MSSVTDGLSIIITVRKIALAAQTIVPIATRLCVARSVCLSHSCTLLKPYDRFRCYLAGTVIEGFDDIPC